MKAAIVTLLITMLIAGGFYALYRYENAVLVEQFKDCEPTDLYTKHGRRPTKQRVYRCLP